MQNDSLSHRTGGAEATRHVAAIVAAMSLLDCYRGDDELALRDFHREVGLNKSRLLRYLGTLEAVGMLESVGASGTYRLGPKVYQLANIVRGPYTDLGSRVRPTLKSLCQHSGYTAMFSLVRGRWRLTVAREEPEMEEGVRYGVREGTMSPLYVSAQGKTLLAFMDEGQRRRILRETRAAEPEAISSDEDLLEELGSIRSEGYAISVGTLRQDSFVAVCVPVLDTKKDLIGCIALAGPWKPDSERELEKLVEVLKAASETVSLTANI